MTYRSFSLFSRFSIVHIILNSRRCGNCCKVLFRKLLIVIISMFNSLLYSRSIVGVVLSLAIVCAAKVTSEKTCVLIRIAEYYDKLYRNMYREIL